MGQIRADLQLNCDRFLSAIRTVDSSLSQFEGRFNGFVRGFAGFAAATGAASVALATFKSGIQGVLAAASETEDLRTSFGTLLGGVDKARARISELSTFAATTPFDLPEVARASKVLETLTKGALATGDGLRMVGDVAASVGEPFQEISVHIGRLYSGLQNGRAVGVSISRLQELGVISATARNRIEDLQKAGHAGNAVWSVAAAEFSRFAGEMDKRSATWSGVMGAMGDAWSTTQRIFGEPFAAALKPALIDIIASLENMEPLIAIAGDGAASMVRGFLALSDAAGAVGGALSFIAPVVAGLGAQMIAASLSARVTGGVLKMTLPAACRAAVAGFGSLRASIGASSISFATMGQAAKAAGATIVATGKSIIAALGGVGFAIAAVTAGFTYLMSETAKGRAHIQQMYDLMDERDVSFDKNRTAEDGVATEEERLQRLKELQEERAEVERRLRRVGTDDELSNEQKDDMSLALQTRVDNIRKFEERLQRMTPEVLAARKAQRDFAASEDEARKKAEELREALGKGMEELSKAKADDSFGALTAIEKRKKLLDDARVNRAEEIDQKIHLLNLELRAGALSDDQAQKMKELLEIRKQLVGVERSITEERQKQKEEADKKAKEEAKKKEEAAERRKTFERDAGLELAKLQMRFAGDADAEKRIERQQRQNRYYDEATAAGIEQKEAQRYAARRAAMDDAAEEAEKARAAAMGGGADSNRRIGLGGAAWGGERKDPLVKAQQDASRATATLSDRITKLISKLSEKEQTIVVPVSVFQ